VFFKINGEVITPSLDGSILAGITRESTIELLRASGIKVTERKITIEEIYNAHEAGTLEEAFGTGTAAVISPIGELSWKTASFVYNTITGIQSGKIEDKFGWTVEVK